jgi:virulence-associated protein VapD
MNVGNEINNFKAVNFDLNVNAIKLAIENGEAEFKSYTSAYGKVRGFLKKSGFTHDQGSGYTSKEVMSSFDVQRIFSELGKKYTWLASCVTKCRLTSFEAGTVTHTDLTPDIQAGATLAKQNSDDDLASSPNNYKPTRNPQEKAQADALRETLKGGSTFSAASSARVSVEPDNKASGSAVKTKTPPLKDKGKGKDKGAGM